MDSITQLTLGAAVGEAVAGRESGRTALLWGGAFGTLPDLDVLANPFISEIQALVFHRSVTHSILFVLVVTPLAGFGLARLHDSSSRARWTALVGSVLLTHIGLDCLTTYGTKVFWPFHLDPVIGGTIFVVDPLYTVPLALGLLLSLRWTPSHRARRLANYVGLALSSVYLLFTVTNKLRVETVFAEALSDQNKPAQRVFTAPTPFNNFLWRGIAETENGFYVGQYSFFDQDRDISFRYLPTCHNLLADATNNPVLQHLKRFSRGYYVVRKGPEESLSLLDLRFGRNDVALTSEGTYLFRFRLVENDDGEIVDIHQESAGRGVSFGLLKRFAHRILGVEPATTMPSPPHTTVETQCSR